MMKMSGIVIRFTENKREVGILKTSIKSEAFPTSEDKSEKCTRDKKKRYVSLKFKCFGKYKNVNHNLSLPAAETKTTTDFNNNECKSAIKTYRKGILKKDPTTSLKTRKGHTENAPMVHGKLISVESILENKINVNSTLQSKGVKRPPIKLKRWNGSAKACLKYPSIKSVVNKCIKDIKQDSSDEESKRNHPNRRLQRERLECDLPAKRARNSKPTSRSVVAVVHKRGRPEPSEGERGSEVVKEEKEVDASTGGKPPKVKEERHTENKKHVASGMWEKVIDSIQLLEEEPSYKMEPQELSETESDGNESAVDYKDLLDEFVLQNLGENRDRRKTLYETRVQEMMKDPNCGDLMKEFYIPPALVEALFHKMAQDQTAVESLGKICETKKWAEPGFTCVSSGKRGFLYTCTLKTKSFTPTKFASNEDLAKELAAIECLEWLGFQQGASHGGTYFP